MLKKLAVALIFVASIGLSHIGLTQAANVNTASEADFTAVSGIGAVKAKAIMEARKKGNFKSWDDLVERVSGLGPKVAEKMSKAGFTVDGQAYGKGASPASASKAAAGASQSTGAKPASAAAKAAKS